ncbi:MAG: virulence RhuM family protein [Candidatus Gracilibacteria bacterium]
MKNQSNIIIYDTDDGKSSVSLYSKDGSIWMNQNQIAELFDTSVPNISIHTKNIFEEGELSQKSVIKDYLTTASDGKKYEVSFYSLDMILAIGFRVRSKRGIQFRKWANHNLKEYMIKGFIMDDERLKNIDGRPDYFDELLARIRDIRASEKKFYQKIRDLLSLSSDYDSNDKVTQMFFAETQNKILYAITGKTAAEIIVDRANENKLNMSLTSWKGKIVRKGDIYIAKNYLTEDEIDSLNRFIMVFLESAELRAKDEKDITLSFWQENIDLIIEFNRKKLLKVNGNISNKQMKEQVDIVYEKFSEKRKELDIVKADKQDMVELEELEKVIKLGKINNN